MLAAGQDPEDARPVRRTVPMVLVVEENEDIVMDLYGLLAQEDFHLLCASTSRDARKVLDDFSNRRGDDNARDFEVSHDGCDVEFDEEELKNMLVDYFEGDEE